MNQHDLPRTKRPTPSDDRPSLSRTQATELIEHIRELALHGPRAEGFSLRLALQQVLEDAGLPPLGVCRGEAHENPYIDNCMCCAPRWGLVGKKVAIR
jgi:hypothetical protein